MLYTACHRLLTRSPPLRYYCVNYHAFETYIGGKLLSQAEEAQVKACLSSRQKNQEFEEIFSIFCYRYCSDVFVNWSMMFAIGACANQNPSCRVTLTPLWRSLRVPSEDGNEDGSGLLDVQAYMMLNYRRVSFKAQNTITLAKFEMLEPVTLSAIDGETYNVYNFTTPNDISTMTFDGHLCSIASVDHKAPPRILKAIIQPSNGKKAEELGRRPLSRSLVVFHLVVCTNLTLLPAAHSVGFDADGDGIISAGEEKRVTKVLGPCDLLQAIFVDDNLVDFCLVSKHLRDPQVSSRVRGVSQGRI